jgi:hypothetical protein
MLIINYKRYMMKYSRMGRCKHGNEYSNYLKGAKYVDCLSYSFLLCSVALIRDCE